VGLRTSRRGSRGAEDFRDRDDVEQFGLRSVKTKPFYNVTARELYDRHPAPWVTPPMLSRSSIGKPTNLLSRGFDSVTSAWPVSSRSSGDNIFSSGAILRATASRETHGAVEGAAADRRCAFGI